MIAFFLDPDGPTTLWDKAWDIWMKGGWAMAFLAVDALLLFGLGVHVLQRLIGALPRRTTPPHSPMFEPPSSFDGSLSA